MDYKGTNYTVKTREIENPLGASTSEMKFYIDDIETDEGTFNQRLIEAYESAYRPVSY